MAYELPPVEKRNANTTDLSVHNAMFLRQNTQAAVIGILKKNGQKYELAASDGKGGMALPIAVHPSLKIDDALVDKEVRAIGRMTYETMYMPNSSDFGPAYSFTFELFSIASLN
ncbi:MULTISPECIES: hypothetical protein [Acinetobacter]|nr:MULTISPECIES: hypothetical protein [Acinetobacter]MBP2546230.1 hypothetical protein [Acinetobacter guillouiae]MCT9976946.1 hypothetical protein [Acinetobacter sp. I-MWF]UOH18855.1 hypothetical protein MTO68_01300 [Acinetobacter sp. NyZ410]